MNELKIEAGKEYRTRDGRKARVYCTDGGYPWVYHGAMWMNYLGDNDNNWKQASWTSGGMGGSTGVQNGSDLISEWIEAPEVDWSILSPWFIYVAMDSDGQWFCYTSKPPIKKGIFLGTGHGGSKIPPEYAPKFTGDWKDSLVCRPGVEK